MHYYKRNLGDYAKKAGRLSMLQHGSYTLLIDACYDREAFPTLEEAFDWTWASTKDEVEAVEFVLRKFFVLVDGRYVQERIQEELAEYQEKAETNARIASERETKRKEKGTVRARSVNEPCTNRAQDVHEASPNQEPLTTNQEPLTINHKPVNPTPPPVAISELGAEPPENPSKVPILPVVALSMAFRACGIKAQPANPKLIALAEQGVSVDIVTAACADALAAKPDGSAGFGYVLAIIERWGREAREVNVAGAVLPRARGSPSFQTRHEKSRVWVDQLTGRVKNEQCNSNIIDINPIDSSGLGEGDYRVV